MRKTIEISLFDLEDDDRICGFRTKDLVATAMVLRQENITPKDLGKLVGNLEFAHRVVRDELERQIDSSLMRAMKEEDEKRV